MIAALGYASGLSAPVAYIDVNGVLVFPPLGSYALHYNVPSGYAGSIAAFTATSNFTQPSSNQNNGFYLGAAFSSQAASNDGGVSSPLTAIAAPGATALRVSNINGFLSGDFIAVTLDNGQTFSTVVNGSPSGDTVNINPGLPSQASSGNIVYDFKGQVQGAIAAGISTASATTFYGVEGFEANISVRTGSVVFLKCTLASIANSDDAVQAVSQYDMGIGISGQTGSVARKVGIGIGNFAGAQPLNSASTVFKTFGAATVAHGIDISSYSFINDAFKSPGFSVSGAGDVAGKTFTPSSKPAVTGSRGGNAALASLLSALAAIGLITDSSTQ